MGLGYGFNGGGNVIVDTNLECIKRNVNFDLCIACQHFLNVILI